MFVSRKVVSGKPLSKLSCVCLPLGKLVNGKHFPVNEKHFSVNGKHFLVKRKIWFGFQESVFPFGCVCFPESDFQESVFLENLGGKHFLEVVKNLEMSIFADYIKFDP
jgi:hypothetical protein